MSVARPGMAVVVSSLLIAGVPAGAQGTLGTQGFGYPPGQLSTRVLATGGGLAQFDAETPVNPAAVTAAGQPHLFLQYEPEIRRLSVSGTSDRTLISRFPVAAAALPIGTRATVAVSVSTFLDRSWATRTTREETIATEVVTISEFARSTGAINDVRLAVGWAPSSRIQVGLGGHVFTGENRLDFSQSFPDTTRFSPIFQRSTLGFTGLAASAGVVLRPSRTLALGFSGRKGGDIEASAGDSVISSARIPDRYSAGISFDGIRGVNLSAQFAKDNWSSLNGLGTGAVPAVDAWETGGGIEALGPRLFERVVVLRVGARYRTLPFLAAGAEVRELAFAGGVGSQFSRNRAAFDITVQYANRTRAAGGGGTGAPAIDPRERALTVSFGLRVRP